MQVRKPVGLWRTRAVFLLLAAALLHLVPACDQCPTDPDKMDPGVCGCGVPDVDSDGDGVLDCNDGCPDDPLKTDPGVCGCGVPDTDSDGDDVPDCVDNQDAPGGDGQDDMGGGDTDTNASDGEADLGAAITCEWVNGWQDHGPLVAQFDPGETVHVYLEWQPEGHDFFGDVVQYKWYHNGTTAWAEANEITEHWYGVWWHVSHAPSVGSGYIEVYWNGRYLGKTNDYTVGVWLGEALTCEWVNGWQNHGPLVAEFTAGAPVHLYLEWQPSSRDFFGDVIAYKWYHNGAAVWEETYEVTEHLHSVWWHAVHTPSVGSGYMEGYWNGRYLGKSNEYTVLAPPAPVLLSPADDATEQPTSVTLDWSDVPGAAGYRVQIDTTCGTGAQYDTTTSQYDYADLPPETTYYWRVKAKNIYGYYGDYSSCFAFTTAAPPPPPSGACCFPDGSCDVTLEATCTGVWHPEWDDCGVAQCPQPPPAIYRVDGDGGSDTHNGTNWDTDALYSIQGALAKARAGDEIWVRGATYVPPAQGSYSYMSVNQAVALYGGFAGYETARNQRDPRVNVTTIQCPSSGNGHGFYVDPGAGTVVIDGFTIDGGWAGGSDYPHDSGGGILCHSGAVVVANCTFEYGYAAHGAGIALGGGTSGLIANCRFHDNDASESGGGMDSSLSETTVANCEFYDNSADADGGALRLCCGGTLTNCTVTRNTVAAALGAGGVNCESGTLTIANSIVWGNTANGDPSEIGNGDNATFVVSYSDVRGGYAGTGNIDADPCFAGVDEDDDRLRSVSPCIDAGDNTAALAGITADLDGNPRLVDVPCRSDTGSGTPPIVDLGAYEAASAFADCNENGTDDLCDLLSATSADCNINDVPDECDIAGGASLDELPPGGDGIPDQCQADCNGNLVPDNVDISDGTSLDCNDNTVPDECDLAAGESQDCNTNDIPDECDIASGASLDVVPPGGDGIPDECQLGCN